MRVALVHRLVAIYQEYDRILLGLHLFDLVSVHAEHELVWIFMGAVIGFSIFIKLTKTAIS
jgi:hypothetical protein